MLGLKEEIGSGSSWWEASTHVYIIKYVLVKLAVVRLNEMLLSLRSRCCRIVLKLVTILRMWLYLSKWHLWTVRRDTLSKRA